ncbi:MAG: hypothetical protein WA823_13360 [Candidatus Acidiferrales bacterium]
MPRKRKADPKKTKLSPLVRSAFEVLEHGLFHFLRSDNSTDMKFALMHIDQAVELFLKEKVRDSGISIYKDKSKETITRWRAFEILENELKVKTPEKPDLELLHEERNNIQHKYSNPSADDAGFHVEKAMIFIRRFVKNELNLDLREHVSTRFLDQV